jgi:thioesterase domain-containing protein
MEDMVAKLKKAYHKNAPICGGERSDIIAAAAAQLNTMDKQASSIASARTMTLMDDAAVGSPSFTNLVKQLQEQRNEQLESDSKWQLKKKSSEAVEEMLKRARESCTKKNNKLAKLKKRRFKTPAYKPEPQTFIVPINIPNRKKKEPQEEGPRKQEVAKGYSEIE